MQVKIILGETYADLENGINAFLDSIPEDPKTIKYNLDNCSAVIEYSPVETNRLCIDCRFWDDKGDNLIGLCQMCGGRKRFSDKSCNKFKDVRE